MIEIVMYTIFAVILLCIFFISYINIYNRFQSYIIRINEAEAEIDTTLRKRFDLLNKSIGIIKANIEKDTVLEFTFKNIRTDREYDELQGYIDDELFNMFKMFTTNFDFDIVK